MQSDAQRLLGKFHKDVVGDRPLSLFCHDNGFVAATPFTLKTIFFAH